MSSAAGSELKRGRDSYTRRAWSDAYDALSRADQASSLGAEDLELCVWSAVLAGHDDEALRLTERLHQLHLACGDHVGAARAAFWLGFRLAGRGEMGRASGWLTRAQRLVEGEAGECVVRG